MVTLKRGLCSCFQSFIDQTRKERCSLAFITLVPQSGVLLRSWVFLFQTNPEGFLQEQAEGAGEALLRGRNMPGVVTVKRGKEKSAQ